MYTNPFSRTHCQVRQVIDRFLDITCKRNTKNGFDRDSSSSQSSLSSTKSSTWSLKFKNNMNRKIIRKWRFGSFSGFLNNWWVVLNALTQDFGFIFCITKKTLSKFKLFYIFIRLKLFRLQYLPKNILATIRYTIIFIYFGLSIKDNCFGKGLLKI